MSISMKDMLSLLCIRAPNGSFSNLKELNKLLEKGHNAHFLKNTIEEGVQRHPETFAGDLDGYIPRLFGGAVGSRPFRSFD